MKDFSAILDTYFRALQKLRDNNKLVEDTVSIFKSDKKCIFPPPMDLEFKKVGASNFKRADRVQVLKEETEKEEERTFPEGDEDLTWDMPEDEEVSRENFASGTSKHQDRGASKTRERVQSFCARRCRL